MAKNARYDVIVGDLFHPDLVGRSALLSLQQFARVKSRLNDNGVFVQWLALNQFDVGSLEIMLRTFKREFTNAHVFVDGFRIALVGFKRDADIAFAPLMAHDVWPPSQLETMSGGEGKWTWLGRYAFAIADSPGLVQDEWKPQIEYRLPKAKYNGDINLVKTVNYIQARRLHVDKAKQVLAVPLDDQRQFENAYIANVLSYQSWIAELKGNDGEAVRLLQLSYQANRLDRWVGFNMADRIFAQLNGQSEANLRRGLEAVLKVREDHVEALKTLYRLERAAAHQDLAATYLARIRHLSPFEKFN